MKSSLPAQQQPLKEVWPGVLANKRKNKNPALLETERGFNWRQSSLVEEMQHITVIHKKEQSRDAVQQAAAGNGAGPTSPNKIPLTTHPQSAITDLIHALSSTIPASYDQISLSVYVGSLNHDEVLHIFEQYLGKSQITNDGKFHHFDNGMKLSRYDRYSYHSIRFSDLSVLEDLEPLRKILPKRQIPERIPSPAFMLSSAEIRYDCPLQGLSYQRAELVLDDLAAKLILKNRFASLKLTSGRQFKKVDESTYNGRKTYSFGKLYKLTEEQHEKLERRKKRHFSAWQIDPKSRFFGKAYLKSFDGKESWNLRIEATLKGGSLAKIGGNRLPENLLALQNRLQNLHFSDFWKLEAFGTESFLNEAWPIYEQSQSMSKLILFVLMNTEDNQYVTKQKRIAKKIAKRLDSKKLIRRLDAGKFRVLPLARPHRRASKR